MVNSVPSCSLSVVDRRGRPACEVPVPILYLLSLVDSYWDSKCLRSRRGPRYPGSPLNHRARRGGPCQSHPRGELVKPGGGTWETGDSVCTTGVVDETLGPDTGWEKRDGGVDGHVGPPVVVTDPQECKPPSSTPMVTDGRTTVPRVCNGGGVGDCRGLLWETRGTDSGSSSLSV